MNAMKLSFDIMLLGLLLVNHCETELVNSSLLLFSDFKAAFLFYVVLFVLITS